MPNPTITVNVTQAHIDIGEPAFANRCPIALAARDAGIQNARVGLKLINGDSNSYVLHGYYLGSVADYHLPPKAREFAHAFDKGERRDNLDKETVVPFSFETWRINHEGVRLA